MTTNRKGTGAIQPPAGVRRCTRSWRSRNPYGELRQFSDGKAGPEVSLQEAIRWMHGLPVRDAYDLDLTRTKYRMISLSRRFRSGPVGKSPPRFELEIAPSKGWQRACWMRIFVGSIQTMTQERLDNAIATLHARWARFREEMNRQGRLNSCSDLDLGNTLYGLRVFAPDFEIEAPPYPTRLALNDVLAWNGRGVGVGYSPSYLVDPNREVLFWPESDIEPQAVPAQEATGTPA